jgi:glycine dehydrogenase
MSLRRSLSPGWYTPYTPYQAEVAQGRLEMLLNFQTMISDLTGLPVSNASLLDEATACAEAMNMCLNSSTKKRKVFYVSEQVYAQSLAVIRTRALGVGVEVRVAHHDNFDYSKDDVFGILLQYPAQDGTVENLKAIIDAAHAKDVRVVVASDLLALTVLTPPGELGADVVCGSAQRFGVPMGFGGPHAAFMATSESYKRKLPGRIIGVSKDSRGKPALRMAMQTREQHIRRDKATSNICTAQALLANMAAAYAIYHGPEGLKRIGSKVHAAARLFAAGVRALGLEAPEKNFFDTVRVGVKGAAAKYVSAAAAKRINLRAVDDHTLTVAFDETTTAEHLDELLAVFASVAGKKSPAVADLLQKVDVSVPKEFARETKFLQCTWYVHHRH